MLSVAALGLLANETVAQAKHKGGGAVAGDIDILNVALALEHEAIEAYQIGAESGLLQKPVLDVAVLFQGHHKAHRDALVAAIMQLGGTAVKPDTRASYVASLEVAKITGQTDILRLAQRLERGAANAYLGVIPSFGNKDLAQVSAKLASDETAHWALLSQVLGDNLGVAPFVVS
ncbi:MAG: ferritin-like domain-containing protein [Rhizobiales bacterium]|nr:ferritin-like domain-containing protein [Hyphomicrobiales bacterium]